MRRAVWASSCESLGRQRLLYLRGLVEFVDNIPGQQILDASDRMVGDPLEYVVQIALRIDVIELTALDQTIDNRRALATAVRSEEQIILAPDSNTTNGSFGNV